MLGNVEAMAQLLRWGHLLGVWGWAAALFLRAVGLVIKAPTLGRPIAVFVANHVLNGFLPNGVQMLLHGFFHEWIPPEL